MEFHNKRRQQFLGERYYEDQMPRFESVLNDPDGLEAGLKSSESEPGLHASLARGVGFEKFNRLMLRYTAGEPIEPLRQELEPVIAAYERYAEMLWTNAQDRNEVAFDFTTLDDYCQLMQLIGLCFLLHRRDLLPRLAALQDGENQANMGTDWLVEEFMSYAPLDRMETEHVCAVRPYEPLIDAMSSENNDDAIQDLNRYLKRWYKDLAGTGWHDSHKPNENGDQGGYYGYWSFEAGAAVLLLGIEDDSSLHKYLYYPKDLVAWARQHQHLSQPATDAAPGLRCEAGQPCPREGWWVTPALVGSRRHFQQGEIMPAFKNDYGLTIWQWDDRQSSA